MDKLTDYEIILLMNYIENLVGRMTAAKGGGSGSLSAMTKEFLVFSEGYGFDPCLPELMQVKLHEQLTANRTEPEDIIA